MIKNRFYSFINKSNRYDELLSEIKTVIKTDLDDFKFSFCQDPSSMQHIQPKLELPNKIEEDSIEIPRRSERRESSLRDEVNMPPIQPQIIWPGELRKMKIQVNHDEHAEGNGLKKAWSSLKVEDDRNFEFLGNQAENRVENAFPREIIPVSDRDERWVEEIEDGFGDGNVQEMFQGVRFI